MVSLPPLRGEMRGYLLKAVARLRFPGSTPAPMWQEAQANLLSMWRILGSATSGPMYSEVCEIRRLPYSSVAPMEAEEDAVRSAGEEILAKASVAATVIKPTRAHRATTRPMPRVEESGFTRGCSSLFGSDHRLAHLPENGTWGARPRPGGAARAARRRGTPG